MALTCMYLCVLCGQFEETVQSGHGVDMHVLCGQFERPYNLGMALTCMYLSHECLVWTV